MDVFELQAKISVDINPYINALKQAENATKAFRDQVSQPLSPLGGGTVAGSGTGSGSGVGGLGEEFESTSESASKFSDVLKNSVSVALGNIFTSAALKAKAALVGFARDSITVGRNFDTAMSQVAATMGTTTDQVEELREFAEKMGAETVFSANQSAQALNYMALAGYDAEKSMEMLPNVLNLAAAGSMDLARASDMVTDAQSALGLSTEETAEMVDKMAMTASKSNTSVEQLGSAFLQIGGTAKKLSGGTTELATLLGILADNGIKGAQGGTLLRNMLNSLMSPTKDAKEMMQKYNISLYDAEGNMRSLNDVFLDIRGTIASLTTQEEKDKIVGTLFNARDMKAAEALLAGVGQRYEELSGHIDNAAGSAQKMADTQLDNLQGDITLFNSAVEGAQIAISEKLTPALRNLTKFGSQAVSAMSEGFRESGLKGAIEGTHEAIIKYFGEDIAQKIMLVKSAVEIAAAAWVTYKATVVAAAVAQEVLNFQMGNGVIISAAQKIGKAVSMISAHPIIALGAALAAASIAFKNFVDTMSVTVPDPYEYLNDSQKQFVDSIVDLRKNISESNKKWNESFQYTTKQLQHYEDLKKSLYSLNGAEEISVKDKERMKTIVAELNGAIEGLNLQLDAETGHLKNERAEIDNTIDAYKRKIRAQAAEEQMLEVAKQQIDLEMKLEQAARERDGAEQKRNQMKLDYASKVIEMQKLQKASAEGLIAVEDQSRVAQRMEELEKELPELKQQIEDQETATHDLQAAHRSLKNQSETLAKTESKLTAEINRGSSAMDDLGDATEETSEKVTDAFSDDEKVKRALKNIEDTIEGYEKAVEDRESVLSKWLSKSMDVDTSEASKKANEIGENIAKEIEAGIENSSQYVQLGLDRIDDVVKTYNDTLNNRVSTIQSWFEKSTDVSGSDLSEGVTFEALDNALGETQDKLHEWSDGIKELSKRGISEGLLQELEDAGPASLEKIQALLSASDADLERYSKAWEQTYSQIPDVAVTQLEKLRSDCENELAAMVADIQAQSPEFSAAMGAVGFDAANGYILALSDKLPEIESTVKSMFDTAKENIKAQSQTVIDPEITFNDLDKALTSAQAELETWSENIDKLAKRGISEGLLQELENAGPESAAKVKALLNASQPDLERYSKTWESTYKSIPTIAEHQLEKLKTNTESTLKDIIDNIEEETPVFKEAMNAVGVNIADGYLDGLNSKIDEIEAAAKKIFEATQGTVETEAEISSPSKVMRRLGAFVGEGFALGIKDENADVSQAAGALAQSAITPLSGLEPVEVKAGVRSTSQRVGEDENKRYVFNLVTPDGNLIGRWIAPFVDAVQGQMLTFSTEGYAT